MKKTKPSLGEMGTVSKSKSKSQSKEGTVEKVYTSPPKCKKQAGHIPKNDLKKTKASLKGQNQYSSNKKDYSSASKSKSKNKTVRHKMTDSPYQKTDKQSKKKLLKFPDSAHTLKADLEKCRLKIDDHRYEQASKCLNKLMKQNPENPQIVYLLAVVAEEQNNTEEARKNYRNYIKMMNKESQHSKKAIISMVDYERLQKLAKSNFYLNNFQNTIEYCTQFLNNRKQQKIYELKGRAQLARKKYGPAIDSFSNALALNKNNMELYEYQGDCYKGIQAYELALNCYSKFNQNLSTDCLRILQKKAECFHLLGNRKKQDELQSRIEKFRAEMSNQFGVFKISLPKSKGEESEKMETRSETRSENLGSILPLLRPDTPTLNIVEQEYNRGNLEVSLGLINKIMEMEGENLKNLYWAVLLLYELEDFDGCEKQINKSIKLLENPALSLVTFFIPDPQEAAMLNSLKTISNKLKELNACVLTEEEEKLIMQRRRKCLQQALNVFKSKENPEIYDNSLLSSKLTMIMEESSLKSSRVYDNQQSSSIFILRFIRKVIKNWHENKFSLQSLEETTDLAYSLVKIRYKQFSILPMHIIYYTLRPENWNKKFSQINDEINSVLSKMSKKYPPSEAKISSSELRMFGIKWQEKQPINVLRSLYKGQIPRFTTYKELHKAIELIADKAEEELFKMNEICKKICLEKNNGFGYKIGLKVDKNSVEVVQQRVLSRIIEKMLMAEIKQKRNNFFNDITVKSNKKLEQYFLDIEKQWEETIEEIIQEKNKKNQQIQCYVYDFLRAKCMFNSIKQMRDTTIQFIDLHSKGEIFLLEIDDRLSSKTRDVVLKFKIKEVVGELQLALEFQSIQNEFNHGLYELFRSPFGSFFAAVMWFSGFALKKNQIFFKEKIKWGLNGLEHLRKFIYEDEIPISIINQNEKLSLQLIVTDFDISANILCAHLCTTNHLYLAYDEGLSKIIQKIEKPETKFVIKLAKGNFITSQQQKYEIYLRLEGTQIFMTLGQGTKLVPILLQNSISAETLGMRIKNRAGGKEDGKYYAYTKEIEECKMIQLELNEMLNKIPTN